MVKYTLWQNVEVLDITAGGIFRPIVHWALWVTYSYFLCTNPFDVL
jgi:hypothetical protein